MRIEGRRGARATEGEDPAKGGLDGEKDVEARRRFNDLLQRETEKRR